MGMDREAAVLVALGGALNRHDAAAAAACYTEDALYREVGTGLAVQGRRQIEAVTDEMLRAFPDATFGLGRVVAGTGSLTAEWWAEGTHLGRFRHVPPTGERFRLEAASVLRLGGGLIAAETVYLNAAALLQRAAAALVPQSAAVERYFAALRRRDAEGAAACFAPGGTRQLAGEPPACGRAAIAQQWRQHLSAAQRPIEVEGVEGGGGRLCARYRLASLGQALSFFDLEAGAIVHERVYANWSDTAVREAEGAC